MLWRVMWRIMLIFVEVLSVGKCVVCGGYVSDRSKSRVCSMKCRNKRLREWTYQRYKAKALYDAGRRKHYP